MNSDITEQYLNNTYDNFSRETQKLLNDIKSGSEEKKIKHIHKELNVIHNIEINILKLRTLKKNYEDKIKNF
jgi:hypothetical protein